MPEDLSPDEQKTVALITRLACERFAPRAAQYDAENRFPHENYADLREHGLMGLTVPKAYGGKGLSSLAYSLAIGEMAKGDSSTALTFNMHATIMTIIDCVGSPAQKERYFTEVAKRGAIFASIGSEPNASPNASTFFIETQLSETAGGYRINGTKHFCSFGDAADYYFVYAMREGTTRIREGLLSRPGSKSSRPGIRWRCGRPRVTA
jgi:alkylation response protein AidB-like acyl-CoA dehydrogenase